MAKRLAIPSKETQLFIVGPRDSFKASRIQRLSLNTDIPSTDIDELGSATHAGQTKDLPNVTLAFSAFDVGVKVFSVLTGTDPDSYPGAGVDIVNLGEIDAVLYVKSDGVATYAKSGSARRMQIRDFTFSYSVDGESTEDYNAAGSEKRWLKYDTIIQKETTGTTSFTLDETPIGLLNGKTLISVILDGEYLTEVAAGPATGEYSVSGTTVTTFDTRTAQILFVYHADASSVWSDVSDVVSAVAIKGKDVDVKILAETIDRVQSVTINGNLNSTAVSEMGSRVITGYQRQIPTVDGTITVLDTDTELIALLTNGVTTSGQEWTPGEGCSTSSLSLTIELVDPCDTTDPYEVLKTVYVPSIIIVGDSYTANVNNNVSQVFNFKSEFGTCVVYSGSI